MAVSKMHPVEALLEAYAAGHRLFGENRVQEFQEKSSALTACPDLEMHLIGPLQSNKSTRAAELFHSIDTVDSLKLATRLNTAAQALNKRLPIYLEVKLSHEDSKHGLAPEDLPQLLNDIAPLANIIPVGLMTVPPWTGPRRPRARPPLLPPPPRASRRPAAPPPHPHPALHRHVERLHRRHRGGQHLRPYRHRHLRQTRPTTPL